MKSLWSQGTVVEMFPTLSLQETETETPIFKETHRHRDPNHSWEWPEQMLVVNEAPEPRKANLCPCDAQEGVWRPK